VSCGLETLGHHGAQRGQDVHAAFGMLGVTLIEPTLAQFLLDARGQLDGPSQGLLLFLARAVQGEDVQRRLPGFFEVGGLLLALVLLQVMPREQIQRLQVVILQSVVGGRQEGAHGVVLAGVCE
jgi:hypothetical protein